MKTVVIWNHKMRKITALILLMLCTSCAGLSTRPETGEKQIGAAQEEAPADTACSYFYFLLGKSAELDGPEFYDEALEAYEKALVCDENATYVMQSLAILLLQMNRKQQAAVRLEKLVALHPTDLQIVSLLASIYAASKEIDKAVATYQAFLEREPENQQALLLLGTFYARHKRYGEAEKILDRLLSIDSNSADGHQYLARLYRELKLFDRAIEHYQKALSLRWSTLLAMETADLLESEGKYEDAVALYQKIIEEDELNEHARAQLADIYLKTGQVDKAISVLEELKDYTMDVQQVDLAIGRILVESNRYREAVAHFRKMIQLYPDFDAARTLLAMVYYEMGDKRAAIGELAAIEPQSEGYADALMMQTRILIELDEYSQAESLLKKAIEQGIEPLSRMYTLLAALYQKKGQPEEARKIFQQALANFADDPRVYFEYGIFLDKTGDQEGALEAMQKVLDINPKDPYALNYIGYTWADKGINLQQAEEYLQEAVRQLPQDGYIRDSLGWLYYKQGNYQEAVRQLEKASSLESDDPTILEHLGDAYRQIDKLDAAVENYDKAVELFEGEEKKEAVRAKIRVLLDELQKDLP
jgi:tetratricopeptide (TPR) repeat protein